MFAYPLGCASMASAHFSCFASIRCHCSWDCSLTDSPLCCPHSIAFAAVPVQSYPCSACDDDFDAAISSAYPHRQNYTDHRVAVAGEPVAIADLKVIECKRKKEINRIDHEFGTKREESVKKCLHPTSWAFQALTKCWNSSWMEVSLVSRPADMA